MPMTREEHEEILNILLNPETEQSLRTEKLQALRVDYGSVLTDFEGLNTAKAKLEADNADLVVSNSKLFRQIGLTNDPNAKKQEDAKTFSETITLESLER